MSFFDALNGGLESMFKELSKSKRMKEKQKQSKFLELEQTPWLFSSEYLEDLLEDANKGECDTILDYLYRFNNHGITNEDGEDDYLNILGIDSYKSIEQKIIDKRWK